MHGDFEQVLGEGFECRKTANLWILLHNACDFDTSMLGGHDGREGNHLAAYDDCLFKRFALLNIGKAL